MRRTPKRTARERGFTLIELMVSITVGGIVIAIAYTMSAGASRALRVSHEVAQTQSSVRLAMEQLRRDITRAGFGGTPNSAVDTGTNPTGCAVSATPTQAIRFTSGQYTDQIFQAAANGVRADGLILEGNMSTDDHFLVGAINNGTTVTLQTSRQSFRRAFMADMDPSAGVDFQFSLAAFQEVFADGTTVQIVSPTGRRVLRQVSGAPTNTGGVVSINVTPAIAVGCFGYGRGARLTPVDRVEYYAARASAAFPALVARNAATIPGMRNVVFARRELDAALNPVDGTERPVLEYVVNASYAFAYDTASGSGSPVLGPFEINPTTNQTQITANPQRLRAVRVDLGARVPGAYNFSFPAPAADQPIRGFMPTGPTAPAETRGTRVRAVREEIFLDNIATRDLP